MFQRMLIWSNREKTTGLSSSSPAEAFLAMCVHMVGTWGDDMGGGTKRREGIWPWGLTPEQDPHGLKKPPNMNNHSVIRVRTKALPLKCFEGFIKAGKSITSNL